MINQKINNFVILILLSLSKFANCNDPKYFDSDTYDDCFQNATGWYHVSATCVFPLTQFERNNSIAVQMCGAIHHSIGYRETNWLIAKQLVDILQNNSKLQKMYWTGLKVKSSETLGVETEDATDDFSRISPFTSIYNPLWADGQPAMTIPSDTLSTYCVSLDLRNSSFFGWRALPCSTQLPILCQNYACLRDTFRCLDNSKCIPKDFLNDGYDDCLDKSDEMTSSQDSLFTASSLFLHDIHQKTQKIYEWPMRMSSSGVLSPSTLRYGRGECTHRWTVVSPENREFVVFIKWLSPSTATTVLIEGKDQNGRIILNSRNATSSITLSSSSFVLTASDTDTRREEFKVFYQDIDPAHCKLSPDNRIMFSSTVIPTGCSYHFTSATPTSYVALLIHKSTGISPTVIHYRNTTVTLSPMSRKKLLILPTNQLIINVPQSTWPGSETQLDIQILEVELDGRDLDVFLIDRELEMEWLREPGDSRMGGAFRKVSVNMIMTEGQLEESTWRIEGFGKTCSEDNIQIISTNTSQFLPTGSSVLNCLGPTTVLIHQSAEPFEFRAVYSNPEKRVLFDLEATTTVMMVASTVATNENICPLPSIINGYITSVSNYNYTVNNKVEVTCLQGFSLLSPITCSVNGVWILSDGSHATPPLKCQPISCPNITSVEQNLNLIPDSYELKYGAMRRYKSLSPGYEPFCVCGDAAPNQWSCYNDRRPEFMNGACIQPQMDDSQLYPLQTIYPLGNSLNATCMVCPSLTMSFGCRNGLWHREDNEVQPYGSFNCDCANNPGFVDPCAPYGSYQQESGEYICNCNEGYKFVDGTCKDRDECEERSDYCDSNARCMNTDGGFTCLCPTGYHTYTIRDLWQWSTISSHLIDGYSCIESTCIANMSFAGSGLNVILPPALDTTYWYRSGAITDYFYATNICDAEFSCVFPFNYHCLNQTLFKLRNPLFACPALDAKIYSYVAPLAPQFHTFQIIDNIKCTDPYATMIGRPSVFCNSQNQWEALPVCVKETCSDPTNLIQLPLLYNLSDFDGDFYLYTTINFLCLEGYELRGAQSTTCSKDWQRDVMYWDLLSDPPTCVLITSSTAASSSPNPSSTQFYFQSSTSAVPSSYAPPASTRSFVSEPTSQYVPYSSSPSGGSTLPWNSGLTPQTTEFPDIIIEDSVVFEERNVLAEQARWMMTADWSWSSSGSAVHQLQSPASFLVTQSPIQLTSEDLEIVVNIVQCQSAFQLAVFSSIDPNFVPPISDFLTVLNASTSGSFVVKLRNVKEYMSVSLTATGHLEIAGVMVREPLCKEVDVNGLRIQKSGAFSMRRYFSASCNRAPTTVNGYCDSRRGWVIQKTVCSCTAPCAPPPVQRDQVGTCGWNDCTNGKCVQYNNGTFDCECHPMFKKSVYDNGTPYCKPDHCAKTSVLRNSGYNCETGETDSSIPCADAGQLGSFCQYQGRLLNSSYIYILEQNQELATAINVCDNVNYRNAIQGVFCGSDQFGVNRAADTIGSTSIPTTTFDVSTIPTTFGTTRPPPPTPSTYPDPCDVCKDALITCAKSSPPFVGGAYCICENPDELGRSCAVRKLCFNADGTYRCKNGGTCNPDLDGRCMCRPEFTGDTCETYIGTDTCLLNFKECVNGRCVQENEVSYCNCNPGWIKDATGSCTVKWDVCEYNNPCQQDGTCIFNAVTGTQSCDCKDQWNGSYCEVPPNKLDCSMCPHLEQCFEGFTKSSRCQCSPGYGGEICSTPVSECDFSPCFNGGTCNSHNFESNGIFESYNCTCPPHVSGANCETSNKCERICENGGTCGFDNNNNQICHCTDQWSGANCTEACSSFCINAHGCTTNGTETYCECNPGFSSQFCEVVDNVCDVHLLVCQNSGTCNPKTQSCDCPDFYFGKYCEQDADQCVKNSIVCENGGTCTSTVTSWSCECPPDFTGQFCENQIDRCKADSTICYNGGTCIPSNGTCACPLGTTGNRCEDLGQQCQVTLPDGTVTPYCENGGTCVNITNGAACDCSKTNGYSGKRCEIKATFNFNLVFNGLDYTPDLVSNSFSKPSIREFTLCSFVQYNNPSSDSSAQLPPFISFRGTDARPQQIVFDNNGFYICDASSSSCLRSSSFKKTPISANTWHHFCIVSPVLNDLNPKYSVYLDGLQVDQTFAGRFDPEHAYIFLAPWNITGERFVGMISITELYSIRLTDTQIGQLAFDCSTALNNTEISQSTLIKWNGGFTRVASYNPGVFVDPAGICNSVKCMFGRQFKTNNYNSTGSCAKDRISPTVLRCPRNINLQSSLDFMQVNWSDEDIAFFDNIGVVRIENNFHNGQQFGIGITAVRYVAFDAAGNSAECTFDVIITQKQCPSQVKVENGAVSTSQANAPFANLKSFVTCNDPRFPLDDRPRFYTCDIMGTFNAGSYINSTYYLPSCGKTKLAEQSVNGSVVGTGTCSQVYEKLMDTIWQNAKCNEIASCSFTILPPCNTSTGTQLLNTDPNPTNQQTLQYTFKTDNATFNVDTTLASQLKQQFEVVKQDGTVTCDEQHPIEQTNGNMTLCVKCASGTYADTNLNLCIDCPLNTYRNEFMNLFKCEQCPDGYTTGSVTGAMDISLCYKNCPIGQFAPTRTECRPCPIGTYANSTGTNKCTCCDADRSTIGTGSASQAQCSVTCPPGSGMNRVEGRDPECIPCLVGFYKEGTDGSCLQCPRGLITAHNGSESRNNCNVLFCSDQNTRRNTNITVSPDTPYSEMCIACEQGQYQNEINTDYCKKCTELTDTDDVPVTCQSTCSPDVPTCNCRVVNGTKAIFANCLEEQQPVPANLSPLRIILPVIFGVLLVVILVIVFCYRKEIVALFKKISTTSDNQHVPASHFTRQSTSETPIIGRTSTSVPPQPSSIIPRPNLRILTDREELRNLPPMPSSSGPSFHVDSANFRSNGFGSGVSFEANGSPMVGVSFKESLSPMVGVGFEANGSPIVMRSPPRPDSDDSSLDSFF